MATRKTSSQKIDPVRIICHALKQVKTKSDYSRIVAANASSDIEAAWATLNEVDQQRITNICNDSPQPDLNAIANELAACGTLIQLQAVKAERGEDAVKAAWKLIPPEERLRLKGICKTEQQHQVEPDIHHPLKFEGMVKTEEPATPKARTLFSISDDLQRLSDLLDDCGDDAQQQELISQWFETLGDERDHKLDSYAALITEMSTRAEVRKAEAKRLQELAAFDENRARLLKDRLKSFFEMHQLKTVQTSRYKLSLAKNGGKAPLIIDASVPVTQLPERFQKVSIDADATAIRDALERGEKLGFAQLGERGTSLRIK